MVGGYYVCAYHVINMLMSPLGNGENPSPLGEPFEVDDPLAPPSEAGGLGT